MFCNQAKQSFFLNFAAKKRESFELRLNSSFKNYSFVQLVY